MFAHTKFNMLCTSSLVVQFSKINTAAPILHSPSGESPCRSVPSLCDSLYTIPHILSLVKGFSKSFLKFFRRSFERLLKPFLSPIGLRPVGIFCTLIFRRLIIIPLSVPFVKRFSESFSKFFSLAFVLRQAATDSLRPLSLSHPSRGLSQVPRFERLIIIPLFCAPVKHFSQISFVFCMIISFPAKTTRMRG